jgi:hypothetical protein
MQLSTDPQYLRNRAKAYEVAGEPEKAEQLYAEADDMESVTASADAAPQ